MQPPGTQLGDSEVKAFLSYVLFSLSLWVISNCSKTNKLQEDSSETISVAQEEAMLGLTSDWISLNLMQVA